MVVSRSPHHSHMFPSERVYVTGCVLLFLVSSYLPTSLLLLLDLWIVRIACMLFLLFAVSIGPTVGIFGFLAMALLFMERNRRKIDHALVKLDQMDPEKKPLASVDSPSTLTSYETMHPTSSSSPSLLEHGHSSKEGSYVPSDDSYDITQFEPVAPTINQKEVMQSLRSSSAAAAFYEELGVGHVARSF